MSAPFCGRLKYIVGVIQKELNRNLSAFWLLDKRNFV